MVYLFMSFASLLSQNWRRKKKEPMGAPTILLRNILNPFYPKSLYLTWNIMSWNTSQLAENDYKFCTAGTQSVRKWPFLGVPSDAEKRVRRRLVEFLVFNSIYLKKSGRSHRINCVELQVNPKSKTEKKMPKHFLDNSP